MALIQEIRLATLAVTWLENIRRDELANAQAYKDAVTAGKQVSAVALVAFADANAYIVLLNKLNATYQANTAAFQSGFTALGLQTSELVSAFTQLKNAAQAQKAAAQSATTSADINAMADALLASVDVHPDLN
jgi:hypothetical protein